MEIKVVKKVLDANDVMAEKNRQLFAENCVLCINVMSSPGSGKTTLLQKTLVRLMPDIKCAVVVGDICTSNDAERLSESGAPVVQINTDEFGGDCHLAAHVVREGLTGIDLYETDLLIVENVGNLVCPAEFDIGEDQRVVVLSTTEGEDKPLKYPLMFRICDVGILNKVDLLPHLNFDADLAVANMRKIHPDMPVFRTSATTEEGLEEWLGWIREKIEEKRGNA
ncbi:MAG: hydrogenase nickel incorporation protein HypB [Desulfatibacillaceae bacterium]